SDVFVGDAVSTHGAEPRQQAPNAAAVQLGKRFKPHPRLQKARLFTNGKRITIGERRCRHLDGVAARSAYAHGPYELDVDADRLASGTAGCKADQRHTRRVRIRERDGSVFQVRFAVPSAL